MKRIIIAVTNDLVGDQRVHRVASTLHESGLEVILVGRLLPTSKPIVGRLYRTHRFRLPAQKGVAFYACFNIWLFFYLMFKSTDAILSNDLDSLPACFLASKIKFKTLIYDSHELFPESPELQYRPKVKRVWQRLESMLVPRLNYCITVCASISAYYKNRYGTNFEVVRNVPFRKPIENKPDSNRLVVGSKIIMYQGVLNIGRGIELVMEAMKYIHDAKLYIAGDGDIAEQLKEKCVNDGLDSKVVFLGKLPFNELHEYTCRAQLGFSLEENLGLNYYYALPNKLFDYIQANIPVLVSDFPEMAAIVKHYNIGEVTLERDPEKLASVIDHMLNDEWQQLIWKENLLKASAALCWENEKIVLINLFRKARLIN